MIRAGAEHEFSKSKLSATDEDISCTEGRHLITGANTPKSVCPVKDALNRNWAVWTLTAQQQGSRAEPSAQFLNHSGRL